MLSIQEAIIFHQQEETMVLTGKVALVTGASSGIGQHIAKALVQEGMIVIGCARREARLTQLADSLTTEKGSFITKVCDLRDTASILTLFQQVREEYGGIDVLINNAGLGHKAPLVSGGTELWREILEVNVLALCVCTREAIADMRLRGDSGYVIHISSMSAHRVPTNSGMYSASKFAVRSLTEGLRQELRALESSIRVSSISPGFVETEFAEKYSGSKEIARQTYSKYKVLQANDIAEQTLFLLKSPPHVEIHDLLVRPTAQPS
jgi:17beta-estradiol 17-dehydrogenase / 3beta-hydroxysteroid 3-dehydrogenase